MIENQAVDLVETVMCNRNKETSEFVFREGTNNIQSNVLVLE